MSAIFGAIMLFYALAFVATTLALAADSGPVTWSRTQHAAQVPAVAVNVDSMTDDERILTTPVAARAQAAPTADDTEDHGAVRAA